MLALIASLLFVPQAFTPTNSLYFAPNTPCGAWKAAVPSLGLHTFQVVDGKTAPANVAGIVEPAPGGSTMIVVYYTPKNVTCPAVSLVR